MYAQSSQEARKTIKSAVKVVGVTTLGLPPLLTMAVALSFKGSMILQHDLVMQGSGAARKNYNSCREGSRRHDLGPSTASEHGCRPLIQRFDDPALDSVMLGSGTARMEEYCTVAIAWQKTLKIPKEFTDHLRSGVDIGSSLP